MNQTHLLDTVKQYRRDLHRIPELGYDLFKTHDYIKAVLRKFGYQTQTVAKTGIVAMKEGKSKESIAFRADMDGLAIDEETQASYASKHPNIMHACGHDAHMAMLLGFASFIAHCEQPNKSIVFIFEPAEETFGGAKDIVEAGILTTYHVSAIFALHLYPEIEEGKLGLKSGLLTAQDGDFDITIKGVDAHGTQPHLGNDTVLAASQLIQQYHTIISRSTNPLSPSSINVGMVSFGQGRNIIAKEGTLKGSIRAFDYDSYTHLKNRMVQIDQGIETAFNVHVENTITDLHPPVVNDTALYNLATDTFGDSEYEHLSPQMLAEDFSYYQQKIPGLFIMLGTKNIPEGFIFPLHSSRFNFNESVLLKGIETYIRLSQALKII